jgi:very-short-patch-repair endonuclease
MPKVQRRSLDKGFVQPYSRIKRIRLDQNPERPFKVTQKSIISKEKLHRSPYWWILHRRGLRRPKIGEDQLEARAIPHSLVKGTKPERIVWKWLSDHYYVVDIDFTFQSSLQGGRLELGGIVCDFIFPILKIALQVQGPTHDQYARFRKDEEQRLALEAMGFHVHFIEMDIIYNEPRFEEYMRRLLGLGYPHWGGEVNGFYVVHDGTEELLEKLNEVLIQARALELSFLTANEKLLGMRMDV